MKSDPQATWKTYYAKIRSRRISEAETLWAEMQRDGVDESTILAIDFVHFSSDLKGAEDLAAQLRENYSITLISDKGSDYKVIHGSTRPYGVTFDGQAFAQWVEFMCDVARSHGCVFSRWSIESPELTQSWSNEHLEEGPE